MQILVNGREIEVEKGHSLGDLLQILSILPERVAVALNKSVIPKQELSLTYLEEGDRIEIVEAVGGG